MLDKNNLFANLPKDTTQEHFSDLIKSSSTRIERIVSFGQSSPQSGWYDQGENEWVCVLSGYGVLEFEYGSKVKLDVGDHLLIPAGCKHKVVETDPNSETVWLAVFYK
ncbi:cupin domain-containing protein [Pseudoalteromonas sp. SSM20]|uniref:cupin domain-containing protein n=1 Tax=Pseudoalteromonas sp. SSM20 TaxID=3139394 RepID=UPI003BAD4FF3